MGRKKKEEIIDDEAFIYEEPTIEEVTRNSRAVLFESRYSSNGCPVDLLRDYFPEYDFNEQREYLIQINGILYDGDTLKELYQ